MDGDERELINRLFAVATARLEDAIDVAVAGQSPRLSAARSAAHAAALHRTAEDLLILARAVSVLAQAARTSRGMRPARNRSTSG